MHHQNALDASLGACDGAKFVVSGETDLRTALKLLAPPPAPEHRKLLETRRQARDRGFRDATDCRMPDSGYPEADEGAQASTRILAYFTGYGEGVYARRERGLPTAADTYRAEGEM